MLENFKGPNVLSYIHGNDLRIICIGQKEDSKTDLSPILNELSPLSPQLYLDMDVVSYIKDRKVVGSNFIKETYKHAHDKNIPIHGYNLQPSKEVDYLLYKEIKKSYIRKSLHPTCSPTSAIYNNCYTSDFSELYTIARITKNTQNRVKCAIVYGSSEYIIRFSRRLTRLGFNESLEYSQRNEVNSIRVKELLWEIV